MTALKHTPLYAKYKDQAKLIDFGGWELPVQFTSIKDEHHAVRQAAGLFDVSHMGEVRITGPDAASFLQKLTTNNIDKLTDHKAQYTFMCYPDGGTVDDLIVFRKDAEDFLLVLNAANTEKDIEWIEKQAEGNLNIEDVSDQTALLALQGPRAEQILQPLTDVALSEIGFFRFRTDVLVDSADAWVARTGYTGEDGFELYVPSEDAPALWDKLLHTGASLGLQPCGLGARDTLRFEAGLALYGQELSASITPLEAGFGFAVKLDQGDFIGREALVEQKAQGVPRALVGLEMMERGIPRVHYPVFIEDKEIGEVTSGTQSPTLNRNLGLALIKREYAGEGQEVEVEIRQKRRKAKVIKTPFYKRPTP